MNYLSRKLLGVSPKVSGVRLILGDMRHYEIKFET